MRNFNTCYFFWNINQYISVNTILNLSSLSNQYCSMLLWWTHLRLTCLSLLLTKPEDTMHYSQGLSKKSNMSRINIIPHIVAYLFRFYPNIVSHLLLGLFPIGLPVKNEKILLPSPIFTICLFFYWQHAPLQLWILTTCYV